MNVRFGEWELDQGRRQLLKEGEPVPLTPKAFELLSLLLEKRPRVVTKKEIYDRLWPSTFVAEVNLSRLVFELREALGDDAQKPRWLRTARGLGYAFAGTTAGPAAAGTEAASACRLILADREVVLSEGANVLGRSREANVRIASSTVSRMHARIVVSGTHATLEDLGSKNGTRWAGRPITATTPLTDGDEIRVGSVAMTFRVVTPESSTATVNME